MKGLKRTAGWVVAGYGITLGIWCSAVHLAWLGGDDWRRITTALVGVGILLTASIVQMKNARVAAWFWILAVPSILLALQKSTRMFFGPIGVEMDADVLSKEQSRTALYFVIASLPQSSG